MKDGHIDYSGYSRSELLEALASINRAKFPRNYENLCRALEIGPENTFKASAGPSPALVPGRVKPLDAVIGSGLIAGIVLFVASIGIVLFPAVNAKAPGVLWFPFPTIAIAVIVVVLVEKSLPPRDSPLSLKLWALVSGLTVLTTFIALTGTGWAHVLAGEVRLDGEEVFSSLGAAWTYALLRGAVAGAIEEAAFRGLFQLKIAQYTGQIYAQGGTALLFIASHGSNVLNLGHLILLTTMAIISGQLAAKSGSILPSVTFHSATNLATSSTILFFKM